VGLHFWHSYRESYLHRSIREKRSTCSILRVRKDEGGELSQEGTRRPFERD